MKHFIAIGAAAAAATAIPGTAFAAPTTGPQAAPAPAAAAAAAPAAVGVIKVPLVNDCGNGSINGSCTSLDMIGTFAGVVKFRHKGNGDLRLMIVVKSGARERSYKLAIYCGATAAKAGSLVGDLPDALTTDKAGAGVAGPFEVPASDVRQACGSGNAIGHLELLDASGTSILAAAPIRMTAG